LRTAQLQSFDGSRAVLTIEANSLEKFKANRAKIAQMLQRKAGIEQAISLTFQATATAV
jgi:hypothetical protein